LTLFYFILNKYEVKQSLKQAWTGPECSRRLRLPDFKTIGTSVWWGFQPYAPASFTHFSQRWVNPRPIVLSEGLYQWKFPMKPSEIEPATFRLVAQCLNQLISIHHVLPMIFV